MTQIVCMIIAMYFNDPGLAYSVDSPEPCEIAKATVIKMNQSPEKEKDVIYVLLAGRQCKFEGSCKDDTQ